MIAKQVDFSLKNTVLLKQNAALQSYCVMTAVVLLYKSWLLFSKSKDHFPTYQPCIMSIHSNLFSLLCSSSTKVILGAECCHQPILLFKSAIYSSQQHAAIQQKFLKRAPNVGKWTGGAEFKFPAQLYRLPGDPEALVVSHPTLYLTHFCEN